MWRKPLILTLIWASFLHFSAAFSASTVDGFNPGADAQVEVLVVQPDSKIVVGTNALAGQSSNYIDRLNPDGTLDTGFDPHVEGFGVLALAVQADGKIVVGGRITAINGQSRDHIGRLNTDGTLDTSFDPGEIPTTSLVGVVETLAIQPDDKILLAGRFESIGGQPRRYLARLNADGTLDSAFNPAPNNFVHTFAVQPDSTMVLAGRFTSIGGQLRERVARLYPDGTVDTSFNASANFYVYTVVVQADGKIVVGGYFTTLGGQPRNYIGRLNSDGTPDTTFNPGANDHVYTMAVQANGKILVGGRFTSLGGHGRKYIARLNPDGTLDADFNPGANAPVRALAVQADGKIVVGGHFTKLGGQPRNHIGRLSQSETTMQRLAVSSYGNAVWWFRSGSGPELAFVRMQTSLDGQNWTDVGSANRVSGGWRLGGLNLPFERLAYVRALGFYQTGFRTGSGSVIESVQPYFLVRPEPLGDGFCFPIKSKAGKFAIICL